MIHIMSQICPKRIDVNEGLWRNSQEPRSNAFMKEEQFREFFDEPGQRVLIGGLVANRDVNLNANLWREAGQGASFSIQKYSSAGGGTPHLRPELSPVSSWL